MTWMVNHRICSSKIKLYPLISFWTKLTKLRIKLIAERWLKMARSNLCFIPLQIQRRNFIHHIKPLITMIIRMHNWQMWTLLLKRSKVMVVYLALANQKRRRVVQRQVYQTRICQSDQNSLPMNFRFNLRKRKTVMMNLRIMRIKKIRLKQKIKTKTCSMISKLHFKIK